MPPKDLLIGRTVRINDDASTPKGPCPFAGQEGTVAEKTPGGRQYTIEVSGKLVNLPMSEFEVVQSASGEVPFENSALIGEVVPSLTNRPVREDDDLLATAATMKVVGVLQPILVRPLPASRLADTFESPETRKAKYEIIAGERRFQAAKIAGLKSVPILLKNADDANALIMQLVENLHRKDLNPLEEARGVQRLIDDHNFTREEAADTLKKSRTHVFETLRLLTLCPEALAAVEQGTLKRSMALLVVQRPTQPMQAEFCKRILTEGPDNGPMSYRSAADLARRKYMTDLAQAPFPLDDANLCHSAGACSSCPKRTGANPELWDKSNADICTDIACFASKKDAHYERLQRQAAERGQKVISGREAREIMPTDNASPAGYMLLDKPSQGTNAPLRQVLGQEISATKVVLIETPSGGYVEAVSTRAAGAALEAQGKAKAEKAKAGAKAREPSKDELEADYQRRWRLLAVLKVIEGLRNDADPDALERMPNIVAYRVMLNMAHETDDDTLQFIFNLPSGFDDSELKEAIKTAASLGPRGQNMILMMMTADIDSEPLYERPVNEANYLETLAPIAQVDLEAIKAEVQSAMVSEAEARATATTASDAKPVDKAKPALKGKTKTTGAAASTSIAQALQSADNPNAFEVGDEVRFRIDLKNAKGKLLKTNGEMGEITGKTGDRTWMLDCPALKATKLIADYTELEML